MRGIFSADALVREEGIERIMWYRHRRGSLGTAALSYTVTGCHGHCRVHLRLCCPSWREQLGSRYAAGLQRAVVCQLRLPPLLGLNGILPGWVRSTGRAPCCSSHGSAPRARARRSCGRSLLPRGLLGFLGLAVDPGRAPVRCRCFRAGGYCAAKEGLPPARR